ncbi:MAG: hypothetical protein WC003_15510 [Terrimicrobiaceae bacterium]|nr:hypothetical protein [Terrimicrobiaceae bacterium]
MENITELLTFANTLWIGIVVLCVLVIGFVAGRKLFRRVVGTEGRYVTRGGVRIYRAGSREMGPWE